MRINRCISCENETESYPCPHCGFDASAYRQPEYALPCNFLLQGRYLIGKVLGQGGFGITYVGWDLALQVKCAIKEYYPNGQVVRSPSGTALTWYATPQAEQLRQTGLETFLREARKMAKVATVPQVVSVRDTFIENQTAYIVMDYVEGRTLEEQLEKNGVLPWEKAKEIFFPVISAMAQVHQEGLVHRDLSPDNLMLLPDGDVKILDLGAAKDLTTNQGMSSMQVIKGGFSPIEQYGQSGGSGPWTDVYAMAATMYYSLTGKLPPSAIDRLGGDSLRWDLPQLQSLPQRVLEAMQKAMTVLAKDRTQSMGEFLDQMQGVSQKEKLKAGKTKKISRQKSKKAHSKIFPIIAAVLVLALLGGGIYALTSATAQEQAALPTEEIAATTVPAETKPVPETPVSPAAPEIPQSPLPLSIPQEPVKNSVACGGIGPWWAAVGVTPDGKLQISCDINNGSTDEPWVYQMATWDNIASVSFGDGIAAGLKMDGTVLIAPGSAPYFQPDLAETVDAWRDIVQVSAGNKVVLGLKADGTVLTAGFDNELTRREIESWTDIAAVHAGFNYAVGLKTDGSVVTTGYVGEISDWIDIIAVATAESYKTIFGLRADGTVVAAGENYSRYDVSTWENITAITAGQGNVFGLKDDGTVVTASIYSQNDWFTSADDMTDIVAFDAVSGEVVGIRSDGTAMSGSAYDQGYLYVDDWWGIRVPEQRFQPAQTARALSTPQEPVKNSVACGGGGNTWAAVGLTPDGKVMLSGNLDAPADVWYNEMTTWEDLASVSIGADFAVGLKTDGTVVSTRGTQLGMAEILEVLPTWQGIVQVTTADRVVLGLRADGTVITAGNFFNNDTRSQIESWTDIAAVASSFQYAAGLKTDGTVVAAGIPASVSDWTDIVAIDTSDYERLILGLRSDGTVVAEGSTAHKYDLESWDNIVAIATGNSCVFGLKADGSVVVTGDNTVALYNNIGDMKDIVAIDAVLDEIVGIKSDGAASVGSASGYGELYPEDWWGIRIPEKNTVKAPRALRLPAAPSTPQEPVKYSVACGGGNGTWSAVGLTSDGKVMLSGNLNAPPDVWYNEMTTWDNLASVSIGAEIAVGLKNDGTVVSTRGSQFDASDIMEEISTWQGIVQVSAGIRDVMGLRADGTVVMTGIHSNTRPQVESWRNIAAVDAGFEFAAGLKNNGTVVTAGLSADTADWTDIVAIDASYYESLLVGLRSDGTVVTAGDDSSKYDLDSWENIVAIATGYRCIFGLKEDGTVVVTGDNTAAALKNISLMKDIVAIDAVFAEVVGIKSDGTAMAGSASGYGELYVEEWRGVRLPV